MKTFRYVYGNTLCAIIDTRGQNISAQTVVRHGRSASGVDECGTLTEIRGDSINSGHRWPEKRYNSPIVTTVLVLYTSFCLKCIEVPGMCPEPRWIDYPAPRSQADSFAMAGPIRHCLLRACIIEPEKHPVTSPLQ